MIPLEDRAGDGSQEVHPGAAGFHIPLVEDRGPPIVLEQIYSRPVTADDQITVIRFSQIVEPPGSHFGNGETPSHN